jgi:hypothetical protein
VSVTRKPSPAWDDPAFVEMMSCYGCDCCGALLPGKYAERIYDAGAESLRALVKELVGKLENCDEMGGPPHEFHSCEYERNPGTGHYVKRPEGTCACGILELLARARKAVEP